VGDTTVVTFDPSDPRKAPLRLAAPSVEIETPSLGTVNNTLSTTVVEPDTATVVTPDRFNELQVETATVSAKSRSARIAQSHSNLTTVGMSDGKTDIGGEVSRSGGFRTSFGFPKPDVLACLQDSRVHVYHTDLNGAVTFYLDGHSVTPWLAALE
jgi:hypothetical protein